MKIFINLFAFTFIILCFTACKHPALTNTFLIPANYAGQLRIIYLEKCGIDPTVENGRNVYKFQDNGFVIIKNDIDVSAKNEFYLVDEKGNKTKVREILNIEERVKNTPAIIIGSIGVSGANYNIVDSKSTLTSGGATYLNLSFYNNNTTEVKDSAASLKLDSLTNTVVNACRQAK